MSSMYNNYSKMKWVDAEIERNAKSEGRNSYSDWYYGEFKKIKEAQEDGSITDDMYIELAVCNGADALAYGYYTSNIHYDLFNECDDKNELEERILYFMSTSGKNILKQCSWFTLNFIYSFRRFLSEYVYGIPSSWDEPSKWIREHGDEMDNAVLDAYLDIVD